jgi:hypothetical protein
VARIEVDADETAFGVDRREEPDREPVAAAEVEIGEGRAARDRRRPAAERGDVVEQDRCLIGVEIGRVEDVEPAVPGFGPTLAH